MLRRRAWVAAAAHGGPNYSRNAQCANQELCEALSGPKQAAVFFTIGVMVDENLVFLDPSRARPIQ